MKRVLNIGQDGDEFIEFQEVHNELLDELSYIITWTDGSEFIMAYNPELGRLDVVGAAPYEARDIADTIAAGIDNHNNGFYWI